MTTRNRRTVAAALFSTLAACAPAHTPSPPAFSLPQQIKVRVDGRVRTVPLEEYVLGSVLAEVSPVDETAQTAARIFEVQAIIARTYAVAHLGRHQKQGFDLCDSTHCQLYDPARIRTSRFTAIAREAIRETTREVLMYGRRPAEALFHADCGGSTTSADAVWGGRALPYLKASSDTQPSLSHRSWRFAVPFGKLREALNRDPRSRVGRRLDAIEIVKRDESGRAASFALRGDQRQVLRGEDLRAILNQTFGDHAVQSTKLTISRTRDSYVFTGAGFGHGVGLCQIGAATRARRGQSIEDILDVYFEGTSVVRLAK
jgi:stage II sporulation protein D (peptidoglycan lytic transglycosylase)